LGYLFKYTMSSNCRVSILHGKIVNNFWQKMVSATLWAIFYKLIWSPWLCHVYSTRFALNSDCCVCRYICTVGRTRIEFMKFTMWRRQTAKIQSSRKKYKKNWKWCHLRILGTNPIELFSSSTDCARHKSS
jgi:hypothetical protein